jgi:hypothetical protein
MKRVLRFLREYKLFGLALVSVIVALILQISGQKTAATGVEYVGRCTFW